MLVIDRTLEYIPFFIKKVMCIDFGVEKLFVSISTEMVHFKWRAPVKNGDS